MEINVEVFSSPRQYETNEHKKTKPIEICWPNQRKKKAKNQKPKKKKENLSEQVPTCPDWLRTNQKKRPIKKCWPNKRNKKAKNPKIKKKERKISAEQVPTCPDLPGLAPTGRQEEHVWTRPPSKHPPPPPPTPGAGPTCLEPSVAAIYGTPGPLMGRTRRRRRTSGVSAG